MYPNDSIYAFDIETTTDPARPGYGLDPRESPITAIAVADHTGSAVFTGAEPDILADFRVWADTLPSGLLVSWNGSAFDIPYLITRYQINTLPHHWRARTHPGLACKYGPTPGWDGAVLATWNTTTTTHAHFDISGWYKPVAEAAGITWGLKPVAEHILEATPVTVDRTAMHTLTDQQLRDYGASDALITYQLALHALHTNAADTVIANHN